jgi:hypothetical protein
MDWSSPDEISLHAEVNDCIVFRKRRFDFFRRKVKLNLFAHTNHFQRFARVVQIDGDDGRPLIDRIQVVEVKDPRIIKVLFSHNN